MDELDLLFKRLAIPDFALEMSSLQVLFALSSS
jgi:hypothetical protein